MLPMLSDIATSDNTQLISWLGFWLWPRASMRDCRSAAANIMLALYCSGMPGERSNGAMLPVSPPSRSTPPFQSMM